MSIPGGGKSLEKCKWGNVLVSLKNLKKAGVVGASGRWKEEGRWRDKPEMERFEKPLRNLVHISS